MSDKSRQINHASESNISIDRLRILRGCAENLQQIFRRVSALQHLPQLLDPRKLVHGADARSIALGLGDRFSRRCTVLLLLFQDPPLGIAHHRPANDHVEEGARQEQAGASPSVLLDEVRGHGRVHERADSRSARAQPYS